MTKQFTLTMDHMEVRDIRDLDTFCDHVNDDVRAKQFRGGSSGRIPPAFTDENGRCQRPGVVSIRPLGSDSRLSVCTVHARSEWLEMVGYGD